MLIPIEHEHVTNTLSTNLKPDQPGLGPFDPGSFFRKIIIIFMKSDFIIMINDHFDFSHPFLMICPAIWPIFDSALPKLKPALPIAN